MTYVFYDTETTGTNTTFDQILQFAAIRTDADLNELDRFEIRCRLLPHVVPAPGALLATRVTPAMLTDPSLLFPKRSTEPLDVFVQRSGSLFENELRASVGRGEFVQCGGHCRPG